MHNVNETDAPFRFTEIRVFTKHRGGSLIDLSNSRMTSLAASRVHSAVLAELVEGQRFTLNEHTQLTLSAETTGTSETTASKQLVPLRRRSKSDLSYLTELITPSLSRHVETRP
jgi:hypothetical protein